MKWLRTGLSMMLVRDQNKPQTQIFDLFLRFEASTLKFQAVS